MLRRSTLLRLRRILLAVGLVALCTSLSAGTKRSFRLRTTADSELATPGPLLQNWDFEIGPENFVGVVTGWTVVGNVGSVNFEGGTSGNHSAALSAGADSDGDMLLQSFPTTPGKTYVLNFDSAIYGPTGSSLQLRIRVNGSSERLGDLIQPPYNAFNPSQTPFHHYTYTFTADSNTSTLEFTDFLRDNQFADIAIDSVSVAPMPPTFTEWRASRFLVGDAGDDQISGWSADPDNDAVPNGLEYFLNGNPMAGLTSADAFSQPRITIEGQPSAQYLTCTFRRLLGWSGNNVVLAVSSDLLTWDSSGDQVEAAADPIPSGDGVTEVVKLHLKTPINVGPTQRKYLRLQLAK